MEERSGVVEEEFPDLARRRGPHVPRDAQAVRALVDGVVANRGVERPPIATVQLERLGHHGQGREGCG
ncbi:MAG TPA: hypothetical protein VFS29_07935 [Motilibacteraceae bacterium]|nr:hypothetical protein [Motilibacteraceae bacterium]